MADLGKRFSQLLDETVTKQEVLSIVESLIKFVKDRSDEINKTATDTKETLTVEFTNALDSLKQLEKRLTDTVSSSESSIKETLFSESRTLKRYTDQEIQRVEALIPRPADLAPLIEKIEEKTKELEAKIPSLPEELSPESIRDKLESLTGDDRLTIEAIKDLREELDEIRRLKGRSGGIFGSVRVQQTVLTPAEAIDDSTTAFTFAQKPLIVVVNGANYREGHGWTFSNGQVVLDDPVGSNGDLYAIV